MADSPFTKAKLSETIESLNDFTIAKICDLVRFQSLRGSKGEYEGQLYVEKLLQEIGFSTTRVYVDSKLLSQHTHFSPVTWDYPEQRFNVVGAFSPKGPVLGSSLAINGHIDVVPVEEETLDQWTSPPFSPEIRDGRLYGRGSGDMKSGFIAGLVAFLCLRYLGYEPAAKVEFHSVIEEECSGNGSLSVVLEGEGHHCASAVLIPEPLPGILKAQLGVMWLQVAVSGKPVHVLETSAGFNAIEAAFNLWASMKQLEIEWNEPSYRSKIGGARPYDHLPHPINFNLGKISGGAWASSVPSHCTFEFRVGFFPGQQLSEIREMLETRLSQHASKHNICSYTISYCGFQAEGVYFPDFEENPVGRALAEAHEEIVGTPANFTAATCTTDVRAYALDSPQHKKSIVTCYGPEAKNIHGIDESVDLQSVRSVAAVYALFIQKHCKLNKIT